MDFDSIISRLQIGLLMLAILAGLALCAQIRFALWAGPKVARFFLLRRLR